MIVAKFANKRGSAMDDVPNPGSDEAIDRGCTCPILDNAHGAGISRRRAGVLGD